MCYFSSSFEFRVRNFEFRVGNSSFELTFRVSSKDFRVSSKDFRVSSKDFRVSSKDFRVSSYKILHRVRIFQYRVQISSASSKDIQVFILSKPKLNSTFNNV